MTNPLLSVVIPAYNEAENIHNTAQVVRRIMEEAQIPFEIIFVSDGSKDATFAKVAELAREDRRIRGLEFSRNFGKEAAMFAGLAHIKGGCAVVMDCDLQHPPQTIVEMYRLWEEEGYEIVEGVKNTRGDESILYKIFAKGYYGIISGLTGFDMENASDFKLLDKAAANCYNTKNEQKGGLPWRFVRYCLIWTERCFPWIRNNLSRPISAGSLPIWRPMASKGRNS